MVPQYTIDCHEPKFQRRLRQEKLGFTIQTMDTCKNILFVDDELVVLNKPAGVVAHRQRECDLDARQLAERELGLAEGELKPIHRLDRWTSGLMLFGRNKRAARYYGQLLSNNRIVKTYLTVVEGRVDGARLVLSGDIKKTSQRSYVVQEGGQCAKTTVVPIELFSRHTCCEVTIEHGRKHQIRAHLAHEGHPLLGDLLYGAKKNGISVHPLLHAYKLKIVPKNGEVRSFCAPLPQKFEEILDELRKGQKGIRLE